MDGAYKTCSRCREPKSLDEFGHGRRQCRACRREYTTEWARGKRKKKPLTTDEYQRNELRRRYGISQREYDEMFRVQGGVCAVCGQQETLVRNGKVMSLCVDHDHETGEVRGLLCNNCNAALGLLRDDPETIEALLSYINARKRGRDAA